MMRRIKCERQIQMQCMGRIQRLSCMTMCLAVGDFHSWDEQYVYRRTGFEFSLS